ncbi:MAG: hypothetical protein JW797_07140 [Bradymonadales bacterium]|nr:hypothetical protein [Bradymonadales bacterium]
MNDELRPVQPPFPFGPLARLASPTVRRFLVLLFLAGFAGLVGVYMKAINRYVPFSVRVYGSQVASPGSSAALRLTVYRPEVHRLISGRATVEQLDDRGMVIESWSEPLASGRLTPFHLQVPVALAGPMRLRLQVEAERADEDRRFELAIPVGPQPPWLYEGGIPRASGPQSWGGLFHPTEGPPRVDRVRMDPPDCPLSVRLEADGGVPVRYLENRFYLCLTTSSGQPLAHHPLTVTLGEGVPHAPITLMTDSLGLAEFRASPEQMEIWRVDTQWQGEPVTGWFELVPSWDGLLLRVDPPMVAEEQGLVLNVTTHLRADRWYFDLFGDGGWLSTGSQPMDRRQVGVGPLSGSWNVPPDRIRLLVAQIYSDPFSPDPQRSVRGVVIRPQGMSELEATQQLVERLKRHGIESDYLSGLQRAGLLADLPSAQTLVRLQGYLLGRTRPAYQPHPLLFDDTESQTRQMVSEVERFRRKANVVLVVGAAALLLWIGGRVGFALWQTRRRTRAQLMEMEQEGLETESGLAGTLGANVGLAGILWASLVLVTLAGFLAGIILLLATM